MALTSIDELNLTPKPGKRYHDVAREWREEFVYFLMVDRFHDDSARAPRLQPRRSRGVRTPDDFYGGKIRGVTRNLDYIAGLGCTAIWLSPIFENNGNAYHGYNISNYLEVDPRFGTKQDLVDLVDEAHRQDPPMRVILDVVVNHSGDNWYYPGNVDYQYWEDRRFDFGDWRRGDRPIPVELRDADLYHRCGRIGASGWDRYPETQHGDIVSLKDYHNDDDDAGSRLTNILIKAHCHWIREADVDGFRVDAVKHMGEVFCSRFSSMVREYAYSLGKRSFFLFGEAATPDDAVYDRYIGPNTSRSDRREAFFGIDSLLDFRLAQGAGAGREPLRDVLKGFAGPETLFDRLAAQRNRAVNRGELGRYLVTFIDNHDSFWQAGRIAWNAPDEQVIAAIGYLLCSLGTPCIYYGTEQGFEGHGGDNEMREAMFDITSPGVNMLNTQCPIYQEIAKIAAVMRSTEPLRFGRMYLRQISGDGITFGFPFGSTYTLAFSRLLYGNEVLVAYNVSSSPRSDRVVVDADLHRASDATMTFLYGAVGSVPVEKASDGTHFVRLDLGGHQFVILR
jgi:glycosidase